jgi:hypothetical protein
MTAGVQSAWQWAPRAKRTLLAACLASLLLIRTVYGQPIDHHEAARTHTLRAVARIYQLIREAPGTAVYIPYPSKPVYGVGLLLIGKHHLFPGWAALFTIFFPSNVVEGKQVRFVVDDPLIPPAGGLRTKDLFVTSAEVPGGLLPGSSR